MKCPNCGLEIPEGHMYCDSCGTEINFVPDFEPEVENEIDATLLGMADELNREEKRRRERREKIKRFFSGILRNWKQVLLGAVMLILVAAAVFVFVVYRNRTSLYYLSLAENARSSGNMESAINYLKQGNRDHPDNPDIIFRLSDYYLEQGSTEQAVDALMLIATSDGFASDKVVSAYESIISIYKQSGDFDKLSDLLTGSDNEAVRALYEKYVPGMPYISPSSGTYDEVNISI